MYMLGLRSLLLALVGVSNFIFCELLEPKSSWHIPRIVAVGDLHGDHQNAVKVLKMANVIDKDLKWAGGSHTILVQTGDVVDRGPDAYKLYKMLQRLQEEATLAGGQAINLLGNHEIMNILGIYAYVTPEDIAQFGNVTDRVIAFSNNGWVGKYLRKLNVTAIVEDTVFCHGGIPVPWAEKGVEHMNDLARDDLSTKTPEELWQAPIFSEHGPTWYRGYALDSEETICAVVDEALGHLNVKRMVVGHTVQEDGRIHTRCQGKVILIDVGISSYYGGHLAALELTPTSATAIYPKETVELELPPGYTSDFESTPDWWAEFDDEL